VSSDDEQARIDDQIEFYREQVRQHPPDWDDPEVQALVRAYFEDPEVRDLVRTHCPPGDRCLELASGPGRFTGALLDVCPHITAVDANVEMHDVNRSQHGDERIEYVVADLFDYRPDGEYELIFAGYWLSHVPARRFERFWSMLRGALAPIVKTAYEPRDLEARLAALGWHATVTVLPPATYVVTAQPA
jgi:SAM-dependent methyltransferase